MYARVHNITNVVGRKKYVKEKENREEVVGFYQTAPDEFWVMLARENQEQFQRSRNSQRKNAKASEAREIVLGLPATVNEKIVAEELALDLKEKLGLECMVAIHKKYTVNEHGEKVLNLHAHIIFAERTLLQEPLHVEEKRAARNYYYDENGRQCKKAEAVKVTKKGTLLQEEHTRYFSNKINFYNFKKLEPLVDGFIERFSFERFDIEKHFPQWKVGKGKPNEKLIKEYNALVKEMNSYFDEHSFEGSEVPLKKLFCQKAGIVKRFSIERTEEMRKHFEEFKLSRSRAAEQLSEDKIEELCSDLAKLQSEKKELQEDIDKFQFILDTREDDFAATKAADIFCKQLEEKYNVELHYSLFVYLKEKLQEIIEAIQNIITLLKKSGVEVAQEQNKERAPEKEQEQEL